MKAIKVNISITGVRSKVDRSLGITFSTPELSTEERAEFMNLQGVQCEALFNPLEDKVDLVEIKGETETKRPSQRLRAVLFLIWKQEGEKDTFEDFYRNKMETIINHFKEKLD